MLKFAGNKPLAIIERDVLAEGGEWNDHNFKRGWDWIEFTYKGKKILYNTFNGRFMIDHKGKTVTESCTQYEKYDWYKEILHLIYQPLKEKKNA